MNWFRKLTSRPEKNNGQKLTQVTDLRIPDQTERLRQIVRHEFFKQQFNSQAETFDEADDFDLPDGEQWVSPYENEFEPDVPGEGQSPSDNAPPAPVLVTGQNNPSAGAPTTPTTSPPANSSVNNGPPQS